MQDKATGSQPVITLSAAAVVPLRSAAYGRLERDIERLEDALVMVRDRAVDRKAWAAFMRLGRTGALLDRTGWTYEGCQMQVKLLCVEDVALALDVLQDELAAESRVKAAALSDGSEAATMASSRRELAIYDALTGLEAMALTAGLAVRDRQASA